MGDYIKSFNTHANYESYINGSEVIIPNISYCGSEGQVHFNKDILPVEFLANYTTTNHSDDSYPEFYKYCVADYVNDGIYIDNTKFIGALTPYLEYYHPGEVDFDDETDDYSNCYDPISGKEICEGEGCPKEYLNWEISDSFRYVIMSILENGNISEVEKLENVLENCKVIYGDSSGKMHYCTNVSVEYNDNIKCSDVIKGPAGRSTWCTFTFDENFINFGVSLEDYETGDPIIVVSEISSSINFNKVPITAKKPFLMLVFEETDVFENYYPNYSEQYLRTIALESGSINFKLDPCSNITFTSVSYSIDNGDTWIKASNGHNKIKVKRGDSILWKGIAQETEYYTEEESISQFSSTAKFNVDGNIMSLYYGDNFTNQTTLDYDYQFNQLFSGCSLLVNAKNLILPATTLTNNCYCQMFQNCTSLITAPSVLPATTLTSNCYEGMFNNCTSLATAPELSATTLAEWCYGYMFAYCSSLTTAPSVLQATILADNCYTSMFSGCTSLTTAPELPATTLADDCYGGMFSGCTSLVNTPELPATTLANRCYSGMFRNCTSLTTTPELPATTLADDCYREMFAGTNILPDCSHIDFTSQTVVASGGLKGLFAGTKVTNSDLMNILPINPSTNRYWLPVTTLSDYCYSNMFNGCTSLTTPPELPATTLVQRCYETMFFGCTSLTVAPELPATTLANNCYEGMFVECTSLTTAPTLPATTLAHGCYWNMFNGCTSLNSITCLATDISAWYCTESWLYGVAASGTFTKAASMNSWTTGENGIPSGWTVNVVS